MRARGGRGAIALAATLAMATAAVVPTLLVPAATTVTTATFPEVDLAGNVLTEHEWRLAEGTGQSNENAVIVTPDGRILDFGGDLVRFSDDLGLTWTEVQTLPPTVFAEGDLVVAPNGDVLGVTWAAYEGDMLQTVRYDAAADTWTSGQIPVHTPFFDRPWISVIPGPMPFLGATVPYVTMVRGAGYSTDTVWYSGDGVTYPYATNRSALAPFQTPVTAALTVDTTAVTDAIQAIAHAGTVPLGPGRMWAQDLGWPYGNGMCEPEQGLLLQPDLTWRCHQAPAGAGAIPWVASDASGALHGQRWSPDGTVDHLVSRDGGASVASLRLELPDGLEILAPDYVDLAIDTANGRAAFGVHAHDPVADVDQDVVVLMTDVSDDPESLARYPTGWRPDRYLYVGLADMSFDGGVDAGTASTVRRRFDFTSVSFLPDGGVVMSFADGVRDGATLGIWRPGA